MARHVPVHSRTCRCDCSQNQQREHKARKAARMCVLTTPRKTPRRHTAQTKPAATSDRCLCCGKSSRASNRGTKAVPKTPLCPQSTRPRDHGKQTGQLAHQPVGEVPSNCWYSSEQHRGSQGRCDVLTVQAHVHAAQQHTHYCRPGQVDNNIRKTPAASKQYRALQMHLHSCLRQSNPDRLFSP